jgi:hypothetical protein
MTRTLVLFTALLLTGAAVQAKEPAGNSAKPGGAKPSGAKQLAGMSVVGNDDAPKALVIVPWKSSDLGPTLDVSRGLDDGRQPVDRDVFKRELDYYAIRAASPATGSSGSR